MPIKLCGLKEKARGLAAFFFEYRAADLAGSVDEKPCRSTLDGKAGDRTASGDI